MNNSLQAPNSVVMVRPHHFVSNPETANDNSFQSVDNAFKDLSKVAYQQVTEMIEGLRAASVTVHVFEDTSINTPDSVFPNNWFSTHANGQIVQYPMFAPNRRLERRQDIINYLVEHYKVNSVIDYSPAEYSQLYLEGTGVLVLDHENKVAFAVRSKRCSESLFNEFCHQFGYQAVLFDAFNGTGTPVYHTNVIMTLGSEFVMIAADMIRDDNQRKLVLDTLEKTGKDIIYLTEQQIENFCGNALELQGKERLLALSQTALDNLTESQITTLRKYVTLLPFEVSAIELAGGSVRCMLAGIHLQKRALA